MRCLSQFALRRVLPGLPLAAAFGALFVASCGAESNRQDGPDAPDSAGAPDALDADALDAEVGDTVPDSVGCDDDASQCCSTDCEGVEELAEQLCGVYLPPQINETDWTPEQLRDEWTYHATEHNKTTLPADPPSHQLDAQATESPETLLQWQREAREALEDLLRLDAATWSDTPLDVRELSAEQRDGYTLTEIDYLVEPGQRVPAYLLVPDDIADDAPGIVLWHGHGPEGKQALVDEPPDSFNRYHAGAHALVQEGYVVLAPDIRSFGETGSLSQHEHFAMQLLMFGRVALGVFVADALRAVDVLLEAGPVDPERVGVGGTSLGGEIALFTAALDPRVEVAVVNGYLSSYRGTTLGLKHCVCQYVPLMGLTLDIADIAAIAAPLPVHFVTGKRDNLFPLGEAQAAFEHLEAAWEVFSAGDHVSLTVHEGQHEWEHEAALARFDAALRPSL